YWNIQPVAWFMSDHIEEGKSRLNFNEFASYTIRRQYKTIGEINDEVKSGGMPLTSYTLVHVDARLSDQQKREIANWVKSTMNFIEGHNPPGSLKITDLAPTKNN
ncbi:MAG: heme-binding domain-containing protein, partial [Ginsengibacter sp.]